MFIEGIQAKLRKALHEASRKNEGLSFKFIFFVLPKWALTAQLEFKFFISCFISTFQGLSSWVRANN